MKPSFATLALHYPESPSRTELLAQIGWNDLIDNPAFRDTCAIRMSVGLLGAGVNLPGARMLAKAGPIKGKRIEPGQGKLSGILKQIWGVPEVYKEDAGNKIGKRSGVVSFFRINGGGPQDGGHIDLISPGSAGFLECARSCHFRAVETWFWPVA